ncbi:hypothetical protein LEN26_007845 [Aphanomyces euteiches]|nr:hypothetical protein LEN26_007845 [Aphanomyces euteiches]
MSKVNVTLVLPRPPTHQELLQESRRQCGAAAKDLDMVRTEWREAVEALTQVRIRIQEWKEANSYFERTHPELVRLENERVAILERVQVANAWIEEAQQRWKQLWDDIYRRKPLFDFA